MCCTLGKMCCTLGRTIKFRSYLHLWNVHFSKTFAQHRNTSGSFRKAFWVFQQLILSYWGSLRIIFDYSKSWSLKTKEWSQNRNRDPPYSVSFKNVAAPRRWEHLGWGIFGCHSSFLAKAGREAAKFQRGGQFFAVFGVLPWLLVFAVLPPWLLVFAVLPPWFLVFGVLPWLLVFPVLPCS